MQYASGRRCARAIVLVMALLASAGLTVFGSTTAALAKTNTVILSGSSWLGGNGVDVYSNDGDFGSAEGDVNYVNGIQTGYRWQCVELINRLYLMRGWTTAWWPGNARQMYDTAPSGLAKDPDGSIASVIRGDVIVFGGGPFLGDDGVAAGHVMIVDGVDGDTINVVQQNASNVRTTLAWDRAARKIVPWAGYVTKGVVHAPGGSSGGSTGPDNLFHGTPPNGAVVENYNGGGHKYVAIGGSLVWIPGTESIWDYVNQAKQLYPAGTTGHDILRMDNNEVHNIEYGYGGNRAHVPSDNSFFYHRGAGTQYVVMYGYSFSIGSSQEVDYLNGRNKAIMVPPGVASKLSGVPSIPNDVLLKALNRPAYYHMVNGTAFWANNFTVIDCVIKVKGGAVQPVPGNLLDVLQSAGRTTSQVTSCSFPSSWALYGPGGAERWLVQGSNPYTRQRYGSSLALHCRLGSTPTQVQLPDTAAINSPAEGAVLGCPDNAYVRIRGNGEVFRVVAETLHYVSSPAMLMCLTHGNPGAVIDIDGPVVATTPRGPNAYCAFEGKMLRAPDGRVVWIKNGQRRHVMNDPILNCVKVRANAGDPINVDWATYNTYQEGIDKAHCPYSASVRFVQGAGQSQVWRVFPDGTRQHADGFCVSDPFTTSLDKYRVWVVPAGEVDGHRNTGVFHASPQNCAAIP